MNLVSAARLSATRTIVLGPVAIRDLAQLAGTTFRYDDLVFTSVTLTASTRSVDRAPTALADVRCASSLFSASGGAPYYLWSGCQLREICGLRQ